jgi:hypothetical protein
VFIQERPFEIQTPTPWNLIGCNMTALRLFYQLAVFSTNAVSLRLQFCKEKLGAVLQNVTLFIYFLFFYISLKPL